MSCFTKGILYLLTIEKAIENRHFKPVNLLTTYVLKFTNLSKMRQIGQNINTPCFYDAFWMDRFLVDFLLRNIWVSFSQLNKQNILKGNFSLLMPISSMWIESLDNTFEIAIERKWIFCTCLKLFGFYKKRHCMKKMNIAGGYPTNKPSKNTVLVCC